MNPARGPRLRLGPPSWMPLCLRRVIGLPPPPHLRVSPGGPPAKSQRGTSVRCAAIAEVCNPAGSSVLLTNGGASRHPAHQRELTLATVAVALGLLIGQADQNTVRWRAARQGPGWTPHRSCRSGPAGPAFPLPIEGLYVGQRGRREWMSKVIRHAFFHQPLVGGQAEKKRMRTALLALQDGRIDTHASEDACESGPPL